MGLFYRVVLVVGIFNLLLIAAALEGGQRSRTPNLFVGSMTGSSIKRDYHLSIVDAPSGLQYNRILSPLLAGEWQWSPKRRHVAFTSHWAVQEGAGEVYVAEIDGTNLRNMSHHAASDSSPVWSPDGCTIAFVSNRDGNENIYLVDVDRSNLRQLTWHPAQDNLPIWSPDGTQIVFISQRDGNAEIYIIDIDGSNLRNLSNHPANDYSPAWSPDGRMIAFLSLRDGKRQIYVVDVNGKELRSLTSSPGDTFSFVWGA